MLAGELHRFGRSKIDSTIAEEENLSLVDQLIQLMDGFRGIVGKLPGVPHLLELVEAVVGRKLIHLAVGKGDNLLHFEKFGFLDAFLIEHFQLDIFETGFQKGLGMPDAHGFLLGPDVVAANAVEHLIGLLLREGGILVPDFRIARSQFTELRIANATLGHFVLLGQSFGPAPLGYGVSRW